VDGQQFPDGFFCSKKAKKNQQLTSGFAKVWQDIVTSASPTIWLWLGAGLVLKNFFLMSSSFF